MFQTSCLWLQSAGGEQAAEVGEEMDRYSDVSYNSKISGIAKENIMCNFVRFSFKQFCDLM